MAVVLSLSDHFHFSFHFNFLLLFSLSLWAPTPCSNKTDLKIPYRSWSPCTWLISPPTSLQWEKPVPLLLPFLNLTHPSSSCSNAASSKIGLPDKIQYAIRPVQYAFQVNEYLFTISILQMLHRNYLQKKKKIIAYLKVKFHWASWILICWLWQLYSKKSSLATLTSVLPRALCL